MSDHPVAPSIDELQLMQRIRSFEERARELHSDGSILGSVHLCIGQEAIPVGSCRVLGVQDAVFATYRGHGWALARGVPLEGAFAELLGREGGVNAGRGGSAYFAAPEYGFYGENSIVAGGAPQAVGAALAARYDGSGRVAVVSFGDGALNQGAMHEAMNFAAAFALPVVFVCENNGYSELTPIADMVADDQLYKRASAYGMPGKRIDGNDVAAVSAAVSEAVQLGRSGGGPTLIEAMTERLVGHYIGDIEHYRPEGEVDRAKEREPIVRLRQLLINAGTSADTCDDSLRTAVAQVQQASQAALAQPLASTADVKEYLYA